MMAEPSVNVLVPKDFHRALGVFRAKRGLKSNWDALSYLLEEGKGWDFLISETQFQKPNSQPKKQVL